MIIKIALSVIAITLFAMLAMVGNLLVAAGAALTTPYEYLLSNTK